MNILKHGRDILLTTLIYLIIVSCSSDETKTANDVPEETVDEVELPVRPGTRPETTTGIPHVQIDVEPVSDVNDELFRRVYSLPGVENQPSAVAPWRALWLDEELTIFVPDAIIDGREYAHIHTDGSLHIFLAPNRASQAVETGWAVLHPFAVQNLDGWEGFVMLYTPQSIDELNVTFQLIVDGYNHVTGQQILATDYYD